MFYFLLMGLLAAGCFLISSPAPAQDTPSGSSQEANQLLSEVKTEATALERDCDQIATWTRGRQLTIASHGRKLNEIRDHINQAGRLVRQLHDARDTAAPWQQQAIDRIYPLLKELADNTQGMIDHLNENGSALYLSEYSDYAKAGYELAHDLAALVSDYVQYGNLEVDFHRLQEKLESKS
jgi:hypothetical protein